MKFIFTGFEPFGKLDYNPSWDVAASAAEALGAQAHLLPVDFKTAVHAGEDILEDGVCLIHIGVAASREKVTFEQYAHNATGPYEALESNGIMSLAPDGPVARVTDLPLDKWVNGWEHKVAARVSRDCGVYVCNATYFHSLARVEELRADGAAASCVFIHVPWLNAKEAKSLGAQLAAILAPA